MNAAYSERYLKYREECRPLFLPENASGGPEWTNLSNGWRSGKRRFRAVLGGYHFHGTENELWDSEGRLRHIWRCLNDDGAFEAVLQHADGREYLVFRQDLYGYSVLRMDNMEEFHMLPAESFPQGASVGGETFIWTKVHYDRATNILAVEGCLWACPMGVVFLDFADPMAEHTWHSIHSLVDPGYELYDDITFAAFHAGGAVCAGARVEGGRDELVLTPEELSRLLTGDSP